MSENDPAAWYYAHNHQQQGPVSIHVLRQMLAAGQLQPTDLVWTQGMPDWKEARAVPDLVPPIQPEPPPSAGPIPPPPSWDTPHAPPQNPFGTAGPFSYQSSGVGQSQHGKAVAALVCSIFSIVCSPVGIGMVAGVLAIVLASNATSNMARTGNFEGRGLAKAGLIIGIVGICLSMAACGVRMRL